VAVEAADDKVMVAGFRLAHGRTPGEPLQVKRRPAARQSWSNLPSAAASQRAIICYQGADRRAQNRVNNG